MLHQNLKVIVPPPGASVLSLPQTMADLNICRATVYRLIDQGKLRKVRIGAAARITRASLDAYKQEVGII